MSARSRSWAGCTRRCSSHRPLPHRRGGYQLGHSLTYRQLVILAACQYPETWSCRCELGSRVSGPSVGTADEMDDLARRGLLGIESEKYRLSAAPDPNPQGFGYFLDKSLDRIEPRRAGANLMDLMELHAIPVEDRCEVIEEFDPDGPRVGPSDGMADPWSN